MLHSSHEILFAELDSTFSIIYFYVTNSTDSVERTRETELAILKLEFGRQLTTTETTGNV